MKVSDIISQLKQENLLDEKEVFVYATAKSMIGGAVGAVQGLVLITVCGDVLYLHRAKLDNAYAECLGKFYLSGLSNIKGKAGLFGGSFSFEADGKKYRFQLPARANKFVDFFKDK